MKHTLQAILALCLTAVVIVVACKRRNYNDVGTATTPSQLFSGLKSAPQNITVTAGRDTVVYGAKGTMLHFYTYSFKDASGKTLTSGAVNIALTEMYKPGDMICNSSTTFTTNAFLNSGGELTIIATMNGQELYANKYGIGFKQNTSSTQPMALFYGNTSNADSTTNWTISDTSKHAVIKDTAGHYVPDTTNEGTIAHGTKCYGRFNDTCYYVFDTCVNFHWINCDYIVDTTHLPLTTVSVVLPDNSFIPEGGSGGTNTQIYLVLPKTNSIILLRGDYNKATNTVGLDDDGSKIPIGWNYEIAVITNKKGIYYYWQTSGVVTSGLTVTAVMGTDTQGDIKARLAGL